MCGALGLPYNSPYSKGKSVVPHVVSASFIRTYHFTNFLHKRVFLL